MNKAQKAATGKQAALAHSFSLISSFFSFSSPQILKTHTRKLEADRVKHEVHGENIKQPGIKGFLSTSTKVNPSQSRKENSF